MTFTLIYILSQHLHLFYLVFLIFRLTITKFLVFLGWAIPCYHLISDFQISGFTGMHHHIFHLFLCENMERIHHLNKVLGQDDFTGGMCQIFQVEMLPVLPNMFQKTEVERTVIHFVSSALP